MAEQNEANERARKAVEQDKELLEVSRREFAERMKGKPTPTQEENDLAACGAHITEHEDDGSGPDPYSQTRFAERNVEGRRPQNRVGNIKPAKPVQHSTRRRRRRGLRARRASLPRRQHEWTCFKLSGRLQASAASFSFKARREWLRAMF